MNEKLKKNLEAKLPKDWHVEETVSELPLNVYAVRDQQNNLVYIQICNPSEVLQYGALFAILGKEDLEKLGVKVEETYQPPTNKEDYYVEESNSEPWNPEKESFEEYKKRLGSEGKQGTLDIQAVERLREQLEEERTKAEDYKAKLQMVAEKKLREKADKLGIPQDVELSPEILKGYELAKQGESGKSGQGNVPLSGQYGSESEGYDSVEAMIKDLRYASLGSGADKPKAREAQIVLDTMFRKHFPKTREGKIEITIPSDADLEQGKGLKDLLNEQWRAKHRRPKNEN
jgi:hypothetical protein